MNPFLRLLALFVLLASGATANEPEWVYLQNDHLRLGVRKDAGACIGFLAGPDGQNVFNSYDHGRFVQQSYYGESDDSLWVKQPWRYNPVQGGDYRGKAATVLEFQAEKTKLYSKTRPRHWATGADLPEVTMEQWITLEGPLLHLRLRMQYHGTQEHRPQHQEIPAVFVQPEYDTLLLNDGNAERRWKPGWPNEHVKMPHGWALWLNEAGKGVGVYVPIAKEATCYRFGKPGDKSACSYVAPITTFALKPGTDFSYEAWFTLGSEAEIRTRIDELQKKHEQQKTK